MKKILLLILCSIFCLSCAAKIVQLKPNAEKIKIGQNEPGEDYTEIGPIEVEHGSGIGLWGSKGSFEGAYNLLKNKAVDMGADYVQIIKSIEPHIVSTGESSYRANKYIIHGIAYKKRK